MKRRWGYEGRIRSLAVISGLPGMTLALILLHVGGHPPWLRWTLSVLLILLWFFLLARLHRRFIQPIQTLGNLLGAVREGDFSIRAREAGTGDPLAVAFTEVNALEEILREQRLGAVEASALLRRVLEEIDVAVLAFDDQGRLKLVNRAGERVLGQEADRLLDRSAEELGVAEVLSGRVPRTLELELPGRPGGRAGEAVGPGRWELRRSVIRQEGHPLSLVVLSNLSRALREEERQAWKRIVRVLGHEINNSLAPIRSIAGSLQGLLDRPDRPDDLEEDVARGLRIISARAEGLSGFMAAYARLARLPAPDPEPFDVGPWVKEVVRLDTRRQVEVVDGPETLLRADRHQLEQALINLLRNAVDATLETEGRVVVTWTVRNRMLHLLVEDEGPGLADSGNLFVPFFTTKPGGTGIGLVLSRQIAEAHGGSLSLENRKGVRGARARMVIPLSPAGRAGEGPLQPFRGLMRSNEVEGKR